MTRKQFDKIEAENPVYVLQWSRANTGAETGRPNQKLVEGFLLQWSRVDDDAETDQCVLISPTLYSLQWGRVDDDAETSNYPTYCPSSFNGAAPTMARSGEPGEVHGARWRRFNDGAAPAMARVALSAPYADAELLQWGRVEMCGDG